MCMYGFRNRLLDITRLRYTRYMKYRNNPTWVRRVVFFLCEKKAYRMNGMFFLYLLLLAIWL